MTGQTTPDPEPTDVPFVQPEGFTHVIIPDDQHELDAFVLGERETVCPRCWLIHRTDVACEGNW